MAVLILPPPVYVDMGESFRFSVQKEAKQDQLDFLKQLSIRDKGSEISTGAFKGTLVVPWGYTYNAILYSEYFFLNPFQKDYFLKSASLIRQSDCIHLGSVWSIKPTSKIPIELKKSTFHLNEIANRTTDFKSPVEVDFQFESDFSSIGADLLTLYSAEKFSFAKIPFISSMGRMVCEWHLLDGPKNNRQEFYPARAHLIAKTMLDEGEKKGSLLWPLVNFETTLFSGVFLNQVHKIEKQATKSQFDPESISQKIFDVTQKYVEDLNATTFKIVKRDGSWIYLDKGRAFGLIIGNRFVGPGKSKLVLMRYEPNLPEVWDASIAFLLHEDPASPLKLGDELTYDQKVYP